MIFYHEIDRFVDVFYKLKKTFNSLLYGKYILQISDMVTLPLVQYKTIKIQTMKKVQDVNVLYKTLFAFACQ